MTRRVIPVRNPWNGEYDYQITPPTEDELRTLCTTLRQHQKDWVNLGLEKRIEIMLRWAEELEKAKAELIEADSVDTGYCIISRLSPDIVINLIRGWCADAPRILEEAHREGQSTVLPTMYYRSQFVPYPLLGVISAYGLMLSMLDAVPALIAGCAVVIKPSELTPRFIQPMMETIKKIPELAAVLTYIEGDGLTGQSLIKHADVVAFTGSVPTGRKVAQTCAERLIPVFLELGGKDPVIVTPSANIEQAATAILRGAVWGTGQVCFSVERIYVHESIHDAFVQELVRQAEQLTLNYPDPRSGDIGPFILEKQATIVDEHLDDALAKGAVLHTGGKSEKLGGGLFMRPVVLTEVNHEMKIMQDETFGPVMPVMRYRTEEEAIQLANDTYYGLSASVIAGSEEEAFRIGERIEAGTISLQDTFLTMFKTRDIGNDSFKCSGLGGHRTGPKAIFRYLRSKALLTNTAAPLSLQSMGGRR